MERAMPEATETELRFVRGDSVVWRAGSGVCTGLVLASNIIGEQRYWTVEPLTYGHGSPIEPAYRYNVYVRDVELMPFLEAENDD
jgi:hypothetical protein